MASLAIYLAFALLTLFTISSALADEVVVVLTDQNFENQVGQDSAALVEFYSPWYIHAYII